HYLIHRSEPDRRVVVPYHSGRDLPRGTPPRHHRASRPLGRRVDRTALRPNPRTRQICVLTRVRRSSKRCTTVRLSNRSTEAVDNSVEKPRPAEPKCRGLLTLLVFE